MNVHLWNDQELACCLTVALGYFFKLSLLAGDFDFMLRLTVRNIDNYLCLRIGALQAINLDLRIDSDASTRLHINVLALSLYLHANCRPYSIDISLGAGRGV